MRKVDPTYDLATPMVIDESSPVLSDDLLEHRLILGQRYLPDDIRIQSLHNMQRHSSGVLLLGVGRGVFQLEHIALSRLLRVYHVRGRFGLATTNFSPKGKITERTSYRHITRSRVDRVCAAIQSTSKIRMLKYAGIDLQSQEAYELSASGLLRPENSQSPPILYSTKCVEFQLPDFTLEITSINEFCDYFKNVIHDIGLQLRSTAVCTGIRRLRYGHFELSHALLRKHWNLESIIDNLHQNKSQMTAEKLCTGLILQEHNQPEEITDGKGSAECQEKNITA
ncbi:hypothetical protein C0Q70_17494 [Pomacea canaliculata]|uniref:Pseudouridine synthase II N-terminal domain-containing protein n=2 Tax=Pomacea canaliculata TaxID=400727 RepID=A0A2T7NKJ6_POMCA|nr:hypothetical protein C0Q70_17494 [Pomacea canaliculata]